MALLAHSPDITKVIFNPNRRVIVGTRLRTCEDRVRLIRPTRAVGVVKTPEVAVAVAVPGSGENVRVHGQFSAPVKSRSDEEEEEKQNYYINMGYAIRTIREEFPSIFCKEPTFDIYREDIVFIFKDPVNTSSGIGNYKSIFWALRFNGRIFFKAIWIDIISIWQPVEDVIMVRWTVHGVPRILWDSHARFDGTSEYKLDKNGKIFQHKVDNIVINSPPRFQVLDVAELIQSIGFPSTPKPTYFEISSPNSEQE